MEEIMDNESVQDYLAQDQVMSIVVAGEDEKKTQTVYSNVEECTQGQENTHCYHADSEVLEDAHASGLSYGKYMAYLELKELDPDISPGDVQGMTMREIRNRIEELQGNDIGNGAGSGTDSGNGNGSGSGNSAGSGTGSGNGNNAGSGNGEGNGTGAGNGSGAGNGNGNGSEAGGRNWSRKRVRYERNPALIIRNPTANMGQDMGDVTENKENEGDFMRILIAEDERDLNNLLKKRLEKQKYSVDACFDGEEAVDYLAVTEYDAVILDIMMPKKNGLEVLKYIRDKKKNTPVLLLTARDSVEDRVTGLDAGADDYLIKPFAFDELLARIRVMLRKNAGAETKTNIIEVADMRVDLNTQKVSRGGKEISLSSRGVLDSEISLHE